MSGALFSFSVSDGRLRQRWLSLRLRTDSQLKLNFSKKNATLVGFIQRPLLNNFEKGSEAICDMATITTTYKGGMLFESQVGNHKVMIDVPAEMAGSDRAPTPPQYFVISLGSCIAAFIASYCEKAGIDATGLSVDVNFDKAENPTRLVNLRVRVKLPRADCEIRKQALLRVAQHCPVHATIDNFDSLEIEVLDRKELASAQM